MPDALLEHVRGAAHELLRERDAIRSAVLARIDAFLVP
jgi:alpha-beta hydrolase superfamily lysophospholipase